MDWLTPSLAFLIPFLPLSFGLRSESQANRNPQHVATGAARAALLSCFLSIVLGLLVLSQESDLSPLRSFLPFSLYLDHLTLIMLPLVSFLGAVVTRYSIRYLAGDQKQGSFSKWLSLTLASVFVVILAGNLLLFALAWIATSLCLHRLLTFYSTRPAAILAARKKFLISRLGDLSLFAALFFAWKALGTWDFAEMFEQANRLNTSGDSSASLTALSVSLIAAAVLKSAQFPFHTWVPDTMETPTPVSALMHAGIINAGGFLVVRFSPLLVHTPAALTALALLGTITALFASIVMLTQTSVKRSLAYSTIAQMGFMMLQCGLGAFSLAILHLVAHSLYKAHAFLSSGGLIAQRTLPSPPRERTSTQAGALLGLILFAAVMTIGIGSLFGVRLTSDPGLLLLGLIFLLSLIHLLWNLWSSLPLSTLLGRGLCVALAATLSYFGLHACFDFLLRDSLAGMTLTHSAAELPLIFLIGGLFIALFILQTQLPSWTERPAWQRFYLHASQGFYLGIWVNHQAKQFSKSARSLSTP